MVGKWIGRVKDQTINTEVELPEIGNVFLFKTTFKLVCNDGKEHDVRITITFQNQTKINFEKQQLLRECLPNMKSLNV